MKSMPSQNGKHRNYLQNTSFSAFPCQLNKPLISAKVTECNGAPRDGCSKKSALVVRSRPAPLPRHRSHPPMTVRTSRVPSRRIAARLPRPARCRAHLLCPVAVGRDVPIAPPRLGAVRGFAPSRPSPRLVARSSHYTRTFPALHCLWGLPTPVGATVARRGSRLAPYRHYTRDNRTLCSRPRRRAPRPCLVARSSITPAHFPRCIACGGSTARGGSPPPAEALGPQNKKTAR